MIPLFICLEWPKILQFLSDQEDLGRRPARLPPYLELVRPTDGTPAPVAEQR